MMVFHKTTAFNFQLDEFLLFISISEVQITCAYASFQTLIDSLAHCWLVIIGLYL